MGDFALKSFIAFIFRIIDIDDEVKEEDCSMEEEVEDMKKEVESMEEEVEDIKGKVEEDSSTNVLQTFYQNQLLLANLKVNIILGTFHKTLPISSLQMHWISVRF